MANIKITELNGITKKASDDVLAIVDVSADETKKIAVEDLLDKNVELIAVTDTEPAECSYGDKYFNTTDNLIYTAIATDTWGEDGEEPISGILYIVYAEQASYSWNGTELISVGGGKEDIVIDDEEPTDNDWKIWIDNTETTDNTYYNDNGTAIPFKTTTFDTLPVGTEVDYDGNTVPTGWIAVDGFNEIYTTLYENDTWSGNQGDITLSDSTANYDYLEVFYATRSLGGEGYKSVKIANPNGKTIDLDMVIRKADDNVMYYLSTLYNVSGTSLTLKATGVSYVYNNSANNINTSTNYIYVKKVVGIKEV